MVTIMSSVSVRQTEHASGRRRRAARRDRNRHQRRLRHRRPISWWAARRASAILVCTWLQMFRARSSDTRAKPWATSATGNKCTIPCVFTTSTTHACMLNTAARCCLAASAGAAIATKQPRRLMVALAARHTTFSASAGSSVSAHTGGHFAPSRARRHARYEVRWRGWAVW